MDSKNSRNVVFVTIGHPISKFPMQNKVAMNVFEGDSIVQIAKKFRKKCSESPSSYSNYEYGTRFVPSELYYAIFSAVKDKYPIESSNNFPGSDFIYDWSLKKNENS